MRRVVTIFVFFLFLAGCRKSIEIVSPAALKIPETETRYCFTGRVHFKSQSLSMTGCTTSLDLCRRAVTLATRYGGYADVEQVTTCEEVIVPKPEPKPVQETAQVIK